MNSKKREDASDLSAKRRAASAKGLAARWGVGRRKSKQVRVDEAAYAALKSVPDIDRNRVATDAIMSAVTAYKRLARLSS